MSNEITVSDVIEYCDMLKEIVVVIEDNAGKEVNNEYSKGCIDMLESVVKFCKCGDNK